MSRRILYIIDSLRRTGTARQLLILAEGLARRGNDVHVCALHPTAPLWNEYRTAGIPTTVISRRWPVDPLADLQLAQLVKRFRPHVVHTWSTAAELLASLALIARRKKLRGWGRAGTDAERWSCEPSAWPRLIVGKYHADRWQSDWDSFIERRLAPFIDCYVTNSSTVRDWCVSNGLPAENFAVIPAGVPPACASDVSRIELLRELSLPKDARLIGVVGNLSAPKRVKDLIWAADLLRVLHDNLRLLIIGNGPMRPQLEQYARLASDLEHIQFLGERADVWRIMPHLDVLWNGSENRRQSIAILEAMAAGVPVVASDVPVNRELVVDGETGYLIPIGSRAGRAARARYTDRIFTDRELAARLAAASRQRIAEHFSAERMVQRHIEIYQPSLGQ